MLPKPNAPGEKSTYLAEHHYPLQGFKVDRVEKVRLSLMFKAIWSGINKSADYREKVVKPAILCLDPGETTGVCWKDFNSEDLWLFQWDTKDIGQSFVGLLEFLERYEPFEVRYEDYKVYSWKAADHSNAALHTPQWIGAIRAALTLADIPYTCKMAQQPKGFWTDDKLKSCQMYEPGLKHARDAERHMLFRLTFPDKQD